MKKILNEWKKFVSEAEAPSPLTYGNPEFEKRFVNAFSRSTQDTKFLKKIDAAGYDLRGFEDKIILTKLPVPMLNLTKDQWLFWETIR